MKALVAGTWLECDLVGVNLGSLQLRSKSVLRLQDASAV